MQVLVVDDDAELGRALCGVLESEGHGAARVSNGLEALHHLHRGEPPGLILLDLTMPVMSGWEFRRRQVAEPAIASIPVVVLTSEINVEKTTAELEIRDYVRKPVRMLDLLKVLARYSN